MGQSRLDRPRAVDAGHGTSSEPDRVFVELDRDPAVPPNTAALTGDVSAPSRKAVSADECSDAPVAAAAHRIFRYTVAWRK